MRDSPAIVMVERRLLEIGGPARKLRAAVRELREHHEDLKQAALEEGLSESEAEARAEKLLGEPFTLAVRVSDVLRQSSWWGRHPVIGFCLLPLVAMLLMMALGLGADALICSLFFKAGNLTLLAQYPPGLALLGLVALVTWCGMLALTTMAFCWLARRSARGFGWALMACLACSFYSACAGIQLQPHNLTLYCCFQPALFHPGWIPLNWVPILVPLMVAAGVWWRRRQTLKLWPVPDGMAGGARISPPRFVLPRPQLLTPSGVIATLAVSALVIGALHVRSTELKRAETERHRAATVWPAERAAVEQQLKSRQTTSAVPNARTMDLKAWINASLVESLDGNAAGPADNLAALPQGVHVFGGIPFDVEGRVQLMGRKLLDTTTAFPVRVRNLKVAAKFGRVHLLHGASGITEDMHSDKIAGLILHYADGSQARISIAAGANVRDWWGPIYQTAAGWNRRNPIAAGSELAWTGSNPRIKRDQPEQSLRLYRSTFENPHPEREVAAIDFVSTVSDAAPFIVGLTLE